MKIQIITVALTAAIVSSCASRSSTIEASYVSSTLYQNLTCEQLAIEAQMVSSRAVAASGVQDKKAGNDAAAMTVGLVLFWPALLFTQGDGASAAEVSRLKGEMQAIEEASTRKACSIKFSKPDAKKPTAKAAN